MVQGFLCVLCTLVGAFYPTLLDMSKTSTEQKVAFGPGSDGPQTQEWRTYPFSPVSVVLVNQALQVSIATCFVAKKNGLASLWKDSGIALKMFPLGAIYAIGEILTLRSVQKGSGPVYVIIANMKLVVAAFMSRMFFGRARAMPLAHWLELVLISLAAAGYTLAEAGSLGNQWQWEGAWMALLKSSLVAFSSVFCEHIYKSNAFHVVLTLQAFWGLVVVVLLIALSFVGLGPSFIASELRDDLGGASLFAGGPAHALCSSDEHAACVRSLARTSAALSGEAVCRCISRRGWDPSTLLAIFADLTNAVSSALVFKRLSAVAKYVCRATSAVPMYVFYCLAGRSSWDVRTFGVVLLLCGQVSVYTVQRHRADRNKEVADAHFAQHYGGTGMPKRAP